MYCSVALLREKVVEIHSKQRELAEADPSDSESIIRQSPILVLLTHFGEGCQLYNETFGITHMFLLPNTLITMQQWVERANGQKRASWHSSVKAMRVVIPSSLLLDISGNVLQPLSIHLMHAVYSWCSLWYNMYYLCCGTCS